MTSAALHIEGLHHGYGSRRIFAGFGLTQPHGRHMLLLGPSGSGKTTLINLIAGLLTPDDGRIEVGGEAISALPPARRDDLRRRKIGIIFQTLRLVAALDVRANLVLAQRLSGEPRDPDAVAALLRQLGMEHRLTARPRELSQGEAQRAAIARALIARPVLLVADEPTSALDDANASSVARLLLDTCERNGTTLLIATHDRRLRGLVPEVVELSAMKRAA